jgi:hypothetical protein
MSAFVFLFDREVNDFSAYAPIILEKKANEIRRSLDSEMGPVPNVRSKFATKERT